MSSNNGIGWWHFKKECSGNMKTGDWFSPRCTMVCILGIRLGEKVFEKIIHSPRPKYYRRNSKVLSKQIFKVGFTYSFTHLRNIF